jgi:hypothetical protein
MPMAMAAIDTIWGKERVTYERLFLISRIVFVGCGRHVFRLDVEIRFDFGFDVILEIVDRVNASAGALLDRAARLVFLLRALLAAQAPRWSGRAEVGAAVTSARTSRGTAGTAGPRAEAAAGTRAAESTARTARARAAEAAARRAGTRTEAAGARTTGWAVFARAGFAHRQVPALEWLRVELLDDFFRHGALGELDEREAAWTAGLAIDRHDDVGRFRDSGEVRAEIRFACTVGEIPDEQTDCQDSLVKRATLL